MGDLSIPPPLFLTKMLSLVAVAMISVKRELLQAIITQFSHHLSENAIFRHFWPFCPICACSWVTPQSHLRFYWQKCYHWVLLQWYLWKESYSRLLPPHFPTICLKIEFLVKSRSWRGGWWTVWSQTPPITLKLGRCAQGHNWVRIVSECRNILMLWYFQPPLMRYCSLKKSTTIWFSVWSKNLSSIWSKMIYP